MRICGTVAGARSVAGRWLLIVLTLPVVALANDGAAEQPGDLRFWDLATGRETAGVREPSSVRAVAYAPDGKTVATGEQDGSVRIRDAASGRVRVTWPGHDDPVHSVAFAPDGKSLLSASPDGAVKLRDVATDQERATLGTPADGVS